MCPKKLTIPLSPWCQKVIGWRWGDTANLEFQTVTGKPLVDVLGQYPDTDIQTQWKVTKGQERIQFNAKGMLKALQPGDVTLQGVIPGLAAQKGFLFIHALGRVGAFEGEVMSKNTDGGTHFNKDAIHWDILLMVVGFGVSLYINQLLSGQGSSNAPAQQQAMNKYMPVMFSGMFLFFPLPAGVLLYHADC